MAFRPIPDLKKRYNASWSLVTGGGSGIGKALAFKLARQGLNVVIVSLDDDILKATMKQLKETFPKLEFRSVGVSFSPGVDYLKKIQEATKDIEIQIIFNNAGFLVTGFFDQAPLGKLLANMECTWSLVIQFGCGLADHCIFCGTLTFELYSILKPISFALFVSFIQKGNATAAVNISHHFSSKLVSAKKKGCIVFTSSVAGFIPTPFSGMYGATKVRTVGYYEMI